MNVREAKDFLVQQTVEQARLEHVSLSDLERRMMYFTETGECPEDPIALNQAFEAEYDTEEYETKIGKLMRHGYWRLKKENSPVASHWMPAVKKISTEDHYLIILWNAGASERPPFDSLKLLGTALLVAAVLLGFLYLSDRYGIQWGHRPPGGVTVHRLFPVWVQRSLLGIIIAIYLYGVLMPWISRRTGVNFVQLLGNLTGSKKRHPD